MVFDDVIPTPLKVGSPALPGALYWIPASLKGREGAGRAAGRHPLADGDCPGPGPGLEHGRIGLELGATPYPLLILTPP
jgi:hypothetical protein